MVADAMETVPGLEGETRLLDNAGCVLLMSWSGTMLTEVMVGEWQIERHKYVEVYILQYTTPMWNRFISISTAA